MIQVLGKPKTVYDLDYLATVTWMWTISMGDFYIVTEPQTLVLIFTNNCIDFFFLLGNASFLYSDQEFFSFY
jgi:hypothetical protein